MQSIATAFCLPFLGSPRLSSLWLGLVSGRRLERLVLLLIRPVPTLLLRLGLLRQLVLRRLIAVRLLRGLIPMLLPRSSLLRI